MFAIVIIDLILRLEAQCSILFRIEFFINVTFYLGKQHFYEVLAGRFSDWKS